MPVVDPESGEPVSDAPDLPPDVAGGKGLGDPGMEGASSTGGASIGSPKPEAEDNSDRRFVAEKGGTAGGSGAH
jgi:hypothetical protein